MRRALPAVLLLLLLGAPRAFATSPEIAEEEKARMGYRDASGTTDVLTGGDLRVSVRVGVLKPRRGYTPLEVVFQNTGPVPLQARMSFQGHFGTGSRTTERSVEVGPRQRRVTWLLVPAVLQAGSLVVDSPGLERMLQPVYLEDGANGAVLVLGAGKDFEAGTGMPKSEEDQEPWFSARFVDAKEAPRELSAYVGYSMVVLAEEATTVPSDVWAVLEAYAASGGKLVLLRPPGDVGQRLPLLRKGGSSSEALYGFGEVQLCRPSSPCGTQLRNTLMTVSETGPVNPIGPPPRWDQSSALTGGVLPLLDSARAPVGRFLLLILVFALAVGPGGLMLARRRGPVAVLVAVPVVSVITCLALIAWSVLVDGFAVHSARYSLTWLDGERSRAVTLGVAAWYANLSPEPVKLPASSALLAPDNADESLADLDWTNGLTVTGGFLPPRTYREWGEVAVLPSRARLVLRTDGKALRVQNALGARVEEGYVKRSGAHYKLPALEDGAEAELGPPEQDAEMIHPMTALIQHMGPQLHERLVDGNTAFHADLPEGGFAVRLGGPGPVPTSIIPVELEAAVHLVRGQVEEVRP
ncbi:hypothetical protein [Pyxidicoccus xibeiensis]|uniref:hypothetical protein n=1 Tax=Pyxidicoccus xibeiensis TaxID=2906759 RepID=UPI0020A71A34|nr:hypothetical protein [Pyxidicoccus xibeiensis]MCP3139211.1 hypothetical protein [Pyxidicoccus xibeiensis]